MTSFDPKRLPCVLLAGCYLAGRMSTWFLADPIVPVILAVLVLCWVVGGILVLRPTGPAQLLWLLAFVAGVGHGNADLHRNDGGVPFGEAELTGKLLQMPERGADGVAILRLEADGRIYRLKVRPSDGEAGERLYTLRHGDRVRVWARTGLPAPYGNPASDRPARSLRSSGINLVGTVKSARLVERLAAGDPGLLRGVDHARARLRAGLDRVCNGEPVPRGLLGAMLLGDRAGLPPETADRLRCAGLVHLIAVSGLHVGLILLLALGVLQRLPWPPIARQTAAPLVLAALVLLIGAAPSILRAATMALIAGWGSRSGRRGEPLNLLAAVGLLLVSLEPSSLHNAGFRLSFAATAGILVGYRPIRELLPLPSFPAAPLAISAAAYLGTAPFTAGLFGTVAPVALVSNLVSAPLCALILLSGYPAMVLAALELPTLGTGTVAVTGCRWLVGLAGMVPGTTLQVPAPSLAVTAGLLAAVPLMACRCSLRWRSILLLAFFPAMTCLHLGTLPPPPERHALEVLVPDVGQGQAVLVRSGRGNVLVDAGGSRSGSFDIGARVVAPQLARIGVRRLDVLAISHGHLDHAAGAGAILNRFEVGQLWIPPGTVSSPAIRPLAEIAWRRHVPVVLAGRGTVHRSDGWTLTSLHPTGGADHLSVNDRSLVLRVQAECATVLLPGDLETRGEELLLEDGGRSALLDADLLVAGHHGAANGSSAEFLAAVSPGTVLISAGRDNRFGHPDPGTVERFRSAGALVLSTDRDGLLLWRCDRSGTTVTGYTSGDRAGKRSGI